MMKRCLAFLFSLFACGCALASAMPKELNITYVKAPFNLQNMVMKTQGLLEKEFSSDGVKINWVPIKVGLNQVHGLMAGNLDMVAAMNTSTLLIANGAGNRILIVDGVAHPNDIFAIVTSGKSRIESIKDLKGKRVVGPKGTVVHHLLVAALVKEGMSVSDVELISMNLPASLTALMTGHADAALLVGPGVQKAISAGHRVLTRAGGLVDTNLVMAASERFTQQYPDVVRRVAKVNRETLQWIQNNWDAAIAIGAKEHGIADKDARELAQWANFYSELTQRAIDAMNVNQAFLVQEKLMKQSVDVPSLIFR